MCKLEHPAWSLEILKAKALGKETGDLSALANPESVDNIPLI